VSRPPIRPPLYDDTVADAVDVIIEQWARERPDLDVSPMGIVGRLGRLHRLVTSELDRVFAQHGLESWEFDVLATLRRSGSPFTLTPGELLATMMVSSGTMTNRIDRLEGRGLVARRPDATDGRIVNVKLTRSGRTLIDRALPDHLANEQALLAGLSATQQSALESTLRSLLTALEGPTAG
jgi:DNA-binding MarR family transcriptional regulator